MSSFFICPPLLTAPFPVVLFPLSLNVLVLPRSSRNHHSTPPVLRTIVLHRYLSYKALGQAVLNQLSSFLQQHNLLNPHQSGFRSGHLKETAFLAVTDALATARVSSLSSFLILLDLTVAFHMVHHQLLISTLAEMDISGTALSWFAFYLADRSYQVAWRGSVSAPHPLLTGVPHGSVLGPAVYIFFNYAQTLK